MVSQQSIPPQEALKRLHVMINVVLIETGRFVSDPAKQTPRLITMTNTKLKNFFPQALNRFHEALDELEDELRQARAVLQRDLAVNLAERARREQANTVKEQEQQSVKETNAVTLDKLDDAQKEDTDLANTARMTGELDVIMADVETQAEIEGQKPATSNTMEKAQKPLLNTSIDTFSKKSSPSKPAKEEELNTIKDNGSASNPDDLHNQHDELDRELFEKTPTTAGMKDVDFDNLFDDGNDDNDDATKSDNDNNVESRNPTSDAPQTTDLTASLNSLPHNPEATASTATSAPAPVTATATTGNNHSASNTSTAATTEVTVSSFLPGLESYANNVNLTDGSNADVPLDLDFLNAPFTVDDLDNSHVTTANNNTNHNNTNDNYNNNNNSNGLASLNTLPQLPIGTSPNNNVATSTGNENGIANVNANANANANANSNESITANGEALHQPSLDDLFSFADDNVVNGGDVDNAFDIDGLADFGDILGNGGIEIDLDDGGGGEGGGGGGDGDGDGDGRGGRIIGSNGTGNGPGDGNRDVNQPTDGDAMLTEFDDMFGSLTGP